MRCWNEAELDNLTGERERLGRKCRWIERTVLGPDRSIFSSCNNQPAPAIPNPVTCSASLYQELV